MRIAALAGGAVAVAGALFSAPWPLGMGCAVVLTVLALRPVEPRPERLLRWAGLLGLWLAVLVRIRGLAVWQATATAPSLARILAETGFLLLACGLFALALVRRATRSALTGLALLTGVAGVTAASTMLPEEPAVVSVTTGVDPLAAVVTGLMLFGAHLVAGVSRNPGRFR
ncbi:hypothetical protein [Actinoplanes sp. NPDC023714]|uniref:hypothetical protein n=1 Tax=Actinoplanes sp. NPDC023714 TaxID=3154322 RepID=UPI0033FD8D90